MKLPRALAGARRGGRRVLRLAGLSVALTGAAVELLAGRSDPEAVLHRLCRRLTRRLGVRLRVIGAMPEPGLIVCNHLSYLDVVVLAAAAPTGFVAKSEVGTWPIFGWFARRSATIFVQRGRVADTLRSTQAMSTVLAAGRRLVLFPEGTSSGGSSVLPFKSSLLEAAAESAVTVAALAYALEDGDGDPAEDVCYWKDHALASHLFRLLGKRRILASLVFGPSIEAGPDRKQRARALQDEVLALKAQADSALARPPPGVSAAG